MHTFKLKIYAENPVKVKQNVGLIGTLVATMHSP